MEIKHVAYAYELLERIYEARNCKLAKYAKSYRQTHGISGIEKIVAEVNIKLAEDSAARRRFHHIMYELLKLLKCRDGDKIRKTHLADEFDVEPKTIQKDMTFFKDNHLIDPNVPKGYKAEPRFHQVWDYLGRLDPGKYCFEKNWREVYPR